MEDTENDGHLGFSFYVDGDRYVDSNEDGQWDHCEGVVIEIRIPDSTKSDFYFEIVDYGFLFMMNVKLTQKMYDMIRLVN